MLTLREDGHCPGGQVYRADEIVRLSVRVMLLDHADQLIAELAGFHERIGRLKGELGEIDESLIHLQNLLLLLATPAKQL